MDFIYGAVSFSVRSSASVGTISANTPLEKSTAAITRVNSVMFARRAISADFTRNIQKTTFVEYMLEKKKGKFQEALKEDNLLR